MQACADLCASTSGGLFWTYHTHTKKCYVKTSSSGRTTHETAVSGNRECASAGTLAITLCSWLKSEIGGNAGTVIAGLNRWKGQGQYANQFYTSHHFHNFAGSRLFNFTITTVTFTTVTNAVIKDFQWSPQSVSIQLLYDCIICCSLDHNWPNCQVLSFGLLQLPAVCLCAIALLRAALVRSWDGTRSQNLQDLMKL